MFFYTRILFIVFFLSQISFAEIFGVEEIQRVYKTNKFENYIVLANLHVGGNKTFAHIQEVNALEMTVSEIFYTFNKNDLILEEINFNEELIEEITSKKENIVSGVRVFNLTHYFYYDRINGDWIRNDISKFVGIRKFLHERMQPTHYSDFNVKKLKSQIEDAVNKNSFSFASSLSQQLLQVEEAISPENLKLNQVLDFSRGNTNVSYKLENGLITSAEQLKADKFFFRFKAFFSDVSLLPELEGENLEPRKGFFGFQPEMIDGNIRFIRIIPKSPADQAGIEVGDIVLSIDNQNRIQNKKHFFELTNGDLIKIKIKKADDTVIEYDLKKTTFYEMRKILATLENK